MVIKLKYSQTKGIYSLLTKNLDTHLTSCITLEGRFLQQAPNSEKLAHGYRNSKQRSCSNNTKPWTSQVFIFCPLLLLFMEQMKLYKSKPQINQSSHSIHRETDIQLTVLFLLLQPKTEAIQKDSNFLPTETKIF